MARQNDGDWFSSDAPCSRTRCKLQPMPSCCHCSQNLQHSPARPTLGATVACSQRYLVAACAFVCEHETDALDNNLLLLKTLQCGACSARVVDGTMRMLLTLGIQSRNRLARKTSHKKSTDIKSTNVPVPFAAFQSTMRSMPRRPTSANKCADSGTNTFSQRCFSWQLLKQRLQQEQSQEQSQEQQHISRSSTAAHPSACGSGPCQFPPGTSDRRQHLETPLPTC